MATQVEDESKTGVKEYEREGDKGESDACYIDQTVCYVCVPFVYVS